MKATDLPARQPVPFAANAAAANIRAIPATQPASSPGYASWSLGFPPETMEPIASGGTPPYGQDFNGLLNAMTNELRWKQAGGNYVFDSAFSTSVGGYPAGAVLKSTAANVLWYNTTDSNTTDPDGSSAAGWVAIRPNAGRAAITVAAGDLTPTAAQLTCNTVAVTGNAASLTSTLRLPLVAGATYIVNNLTTGSGATLNVQGTTGAGITVAQNSAVVVFSDGTNYYAAGAVPSGQYLPANGTAVAATKLATARNFNLTGPVTWSASAAFDGTADVTFTSAVADGAFTIAKTSGLQTALDGKLGLGGGTLTGALSSVGTNYGSAVAASVTTLSRHIALYGSEYGFSVTANRINYVVGSGDAHVFVVNGVDIVNISASSVGINQPVNAILGVHVTGGTTAFNGQGAYVGWNRNNGTQNGETDFINHHGGGSGGFAWWDTDGTTYNLAAWMSAQGALTLNGGVTANGAYKFAFGSVGTQVIVQAIGWSGGVIRVQAALEADASYSLYAYNTSGSYLNQMFTCSPAGAFVANSTVRGGSDVRVKANVTPITDALSKVRAYLVGVEYDRTDDGLRHEAGFIAQSVKKGLPHLVGVHDNGALKDFHSMDYMHTAPYLAAAVTELHDVVLEQKRVIEEMRAVLASLRSGA